MNDNEIKAELDRIIASMEKCGLSGCEEEMFTMGFNHFKKRIYDKLRESQNPDTSDEALHIGSVVGQSEQLVCQSCNKHYRLIGGGAIHEICTCHL